MPVQPQQQVPVQPTSVLPLIGTISLAVAIAIGAIDLPLWALVFVALFIRWCASIYNASRNQLLPVNPLQLRLTLMDRDFNESDYEMLLALDDYGPPIVNHEKAKQIDAAISTLAQRRTTPEVLEKLRLENKHTCPICLEDFACDEDILTLPCSHHFHATELENWLRRKPRCPVCVSDLPLC